LVLKEGNSEYHFRKRYRVLRPLTLALLITMGVVAALAFAQEGKELIGTPAPDWEVTDWFNSEPLSLRQLKGKVVLIRWWTGPECSYCAASAPHLNRWHEAYHPKGLVVIGFYHHKSPGSLTHQHVADLVERYGFRFPVAVDPQWQTLQRWWLKDSDRKWTSVSFLIDRQGIIRYIHPGGSYTAEEAQTLESMIQKLLGS